jgi:hypothetical protein
MREVGSAPRAVQAGEPGDLLEPVRGVPTRCSPVAPAAIRSGCAPAPPLPGGRPPMVPPPKLPTCRRLLQASCFRIFVLILSLIFAAPVRSQAQGRLDRWPTLRQTFVPSWQTVPHPAVVRVVVAENNGASVGSGTLVDAHDRYGIVVTNWHVVRDAQGPISVIFPDGYRSAAQVLKTDRDWDLAALAVWRPTAVTPVTLARQAPRPGDVLTIAGYGSGPYRAASGRCTQYVAPEKDLPYEMVELSAAARQGDSGGPIFNARGELAGVLFGSNGKTTSGSFAGRVQSFLAPTQLVIRQPGSNAIALQPKTDLHPNTPTVESHAAPQVALRPDTSLLSGAAGQGTSLTSRATQGEPVTLRPDPPPLEAVRNGPQPTVGYQADPSSDSPTGARPIAPPGDDRLADTRNLVNPASRSVTGAPGEYLVTTPNTAEPPSHRSATVHTLLGNSPLDWAKSLFALIGLLAVLLHTVRLFGERAQDIDEE